jgi:large subunit ribosomal protein L9
MEVILLQDVENLGSKYDLVKVKPGYGRNYLIPKGMAKIANASNKKHLEEIKRQQSAKMAKMIEDAKALAAKISSTKVVVGTKAGSTGKLFGSVTNIQLAEALKTQFGIEVDRKKITLSQDIKELGTFKGSVHLFKDVDAEFEFEVVAE